MAEKTTQDGSPEAFESETPDYVMTLDDSLVLDLDGFSGPIDVLLALARDHKARLAFQLQRLEAMRKASEQLMQLPQLGQEFFARGAPDPVIVETTTEFSAKLYDLLSVYGMIRQRNESSVLHIAPLNLYSMDDALSRLSKLIGTIPDWTVLSNFLPEGDGDALVVRSGIASTFAASLELTKQGKLQLSQSETFAPIFLRGRKDDPDNGQI